MDFGAVLQTNPPASRTVHLAKLAEQYGFSHVWTFDSHLLWQEPYVIYSAILAETRRVKVGPFVTNPATRDWTVTASVFATLNEMYGNRTVVGIGRGDSAVRVTNGKPTTLKELRESIHVIRELGNSRSVANVVGLPLVTRTAESPRPIPQTVRLPNISLRVAKTDAVTVQSRVAGLVTKGPTLMRCVCARIWL